MLMPMGIFLAVTAVVGAVAFLVIGREGTSRASERLDAVVGKGGARKDSSADLLLAQAMRERDQQTLLDQLTPEFFNLDRVIMQADANIRSSALFGVALLLAVVGGMLSMFAVGTVYVAPVGALVFFSIPFLWLFNKRSRRLASFAGQLPEGLELVARALRAGHSLAAGIHVVAEEMPAPISKEFGRVYEEQNLGIPLEEALRGMTERVPNLDLNFFVTAVNIQRQTGGDLAEILDKIGYVIRERYKILGQVKALTGEGRLSGIVLIALPFVLFGVMLHISYDYVKLLWTDELGIKMAVAAMVSQLIGAYVIKKIVDIKV
jgi:tight adherence protein B